MANDLAVLKAFIAVASTYPRVRHGKWIPVSYWTPKVGLKLQESIKARRLLKVLEKLHVTNRDFTAEDSTTFGNILKVESTERRISKDEGAGLTRVAFLYIVTAAAPADTLPDNQTELARFFQSRYEQYLKRKSMLDPKNFPPKAVLPKIDTTDSLADDTVPSLACVTPQSEESELCKDENKDIMVLLQSIIKPEFLCRVDLLKTDVCLDDFCSTVQSIGRRAQARANQQHYETLAKDRYDDNITADQEKYEKLFKRFCCPWSKHAIQTFLQTALQIADDGDPTVLQLQKYGGIGYGRRLVGVIPGNTAKKFYKNGKAWMPNLYDAIAGGSMTRYDVCFWLIKLH